MADLWNGLDTRARILSAAAALVCVAALLFLGGGAVLDATPTTSEGVGEAASPDEPAVRVTDPVAPEEPPAASAPRGGGGGGGIVSAPSSQSAGTVDALEAYLNREHDPSKYQFVRPGDRPVDPAVAAAGRRLMKYADQYLACRNVSADWRTCMRIEVEGVVPTRWEDRYFTAYSMASNGQRVVLVYSRGKFCRTMSDLKGCNRW